MDSAAEDPELETEAKAKAKIREFEGQIDAASAELNALSVLRIGCAPVGVESIPVKVMKPLEDAAIRLKSLDQDADRHLAAIAKWHELANRIYKLFRAETSQRKSLPWTTDDSTRRRIEAEIEKRDRHLQGTLANCVTQLIKAHQGYNDNRLKAKSVLDPVLDEYSKLQRVLVALKETSKFVDDGRALSIRNENLCRAKAKLCSMKIEVATDEQEIRELTREMSGLHVKMREFDREFSSFKFEDTQLKILLAIERCLQTPEPVSAERLEREMIVVKHVLAYANGDAIADTIVNSPAFQIDSFELIK